MITDKSTKKREKDLKRSSWTTGTEAEALNLCIGENFQVHYFDAETYQRLRARFSRLKSKTGKVMSVSLDENIITITRLEDKEEQ